MMNDLNAQAEARVTRTKQVCIIGGGTAGILLAKLLTERGLKVILLECGADQARTPAEQHEQCEQAGIPYRGAESGRSFGLGGTSALWGGQMISMSGSDFDARPYAGLPAWPVAHEEITKYFQVVRQQVGLPSEDADRQQTLATLAAQNYKGIRDFGANFVLRLSEWLPFRKRNFARSFAATLQTSPTLEIWLNAAVTELEHESSGTGARISKVVAQAANGNRLEVQADVVVVCAGALESTRLLLAFDESSNGLVTRAGAPLGHYFSDHLSLTCGHFKCHDWRRYIEAVTPIFRRGIMHTPRLELSPTVQTSTGVSSGFAHFVFITAGDTGFDVVRALLRRRQGERTPLAITPRILIRIVHDVMAMAYWRIIKRRLWIPQQADLSLRIDIEQLPNYDSRLYLSPERDAYGRKRLIVDWRIQPADIEAIKTVSRLALDAWKKSPLRELADLELELPEEFDLFQNSYDVFHPTGSIRMGASPADSVLNRDLRLWGLENCYVSTTAVFPSGGSANPGLTHLALTARLAEKIVADLKP